MKQAVNDLLGSKRFLVAMLAILAAVVAWKLGGATPQETADHIQKILMGLAALYGLENIATAIPAAPKGSHIVPDAPHVSVIP